MRWIRGLSLAGIAPFLGVVLYLHKTSSEWTICGFRLVTGVPCPGCGLTRATCSFLHGDLFAGLQMHWLFLPVLTYLGILWLGIVARGFGSTWKPALHPATHLLLVCLLGYHGFRLILFFASGGFEIAATQNLISRLLLN
jgi:hypothetical protein